VSQTELKKSLEFVVDSCVNNVGVNLNTASPYLLSHISGISASLAKAIADYRVKNGLFKSRADLLKVPRFSDKVFEQSAGFLRIPAGENPLDNTGVHPERYASLEGVAKRTGKKVADFIGSGVSLLKTDKAFAAEVGALTFSDIVKELEKPGRDPREEFVSFNYREDIHEVKDLKPGMMCPGIVTNVTNFGAFVDIGVHQDGLVHISQLSDVFVKDPREVVNPGDKVQVRVVEINLEKNQIALSMKKERSVSDAPSMGTGASSGGGGHGGPRRGAPPPPPPKMQELKNNAFAGLAGLKKNLKA
ncbi:MAG: S1 RNA-binding domain-containing protein, partial [Proteobacteria bacterium]